MNSVTNILNESEEVYEKKNEDYGDSWRLVGKTLALWIEESDQDEITIPADEDFLTALGLYTRRLDKMIRSFNGTFLKDGYEVDENLSETVGDQVPYAAMHTLTAENIEDSI